MATTSIRNVRLAGIAAAVPRTIVRTTDYAYLSPDDQQKFIKTTGIEQRRVSSSEQCTSDFCQKSAECLIEQLGWRRNEIELVVCVTQTPDYPIPATGILLQSRLGLSRDCLAFDVNLGCSGYVYGLMIAASMLSSLGRKKALLLVGDTSTKSTHPQDRTASPLFGDGGTATALSFDPDAPPLFFDLHSDGAGWEAIVMRSGGYRHPLKPESLQPKEVEPGVVRAPINVELNGVDVFNFGIREVPGTVDAVLRAASAHVPSVDYFVFHQANRLMNEMIRKKIKIPEEKCLYSLKNYGNTSCSSIPLTVVASAREAGVQDHKRWVFCGFGVGLSWASAWVETDNLVCPPLLEM